ncbi:hypothetical protein GHT09_011838 [Marmota monax]|uniref:Uncharacterized protein n=1 Tax=Marmota monax TaxID=9995 RepID=A0A834UYG6_MARMO|nr:hypothetical protein GHT09_011838 [Marmota monax]
MVIQAQPLGLKRMSFHLGSLNGETHTVMGEKEEPRVPLDTDPGLCTQLPTGQGMPWALPYSKHGLCHQSSALRSLRPGDVLQAEHRTIETRQVSVTKKWGKL